MLQDDQIVPEITLPAFGWRMRPDPGYVVLQLAITDKRSDDPSYELWATMDRCSLPHEHWIFAVSGRRMVYSSRAREHEVHGEIIIIDTGTRLNDTCMHSVVDYQFRACS